MESVSPPLRNSVGRSSVPSLDRALTVLELVARSNVGFSIADMSRKLALPKSSVHLLMTTLESRGYLWKNPRSRKYFLGLGLAELNRTTFTNLQLRLEAKPFLVELAQKSGLEVHLAVLEGDEAVLIESIWAPGSAKPKTSPGKRLDTNCTGVGKTLIAFLSDEDFNERFQNRHFPRHNPHSIYSINRLRRELAKIREEGYALDNEEDEVGIRCVGVPILDQTEKVVAAVSVAGTTDEIPEGRIAEISRIARATAARISRHLGYRRLGPW